MPKDGEGRIVSEIILTEAGTVTFGTITYNLGDAGQTYVYTVTEEAEGFGNGWIADHTTAA